MEFQQSNYKIENIASIERLDDFDDEYVYDETCAVQKMLYSRFGAR